MRKPPDPQKAKPRLLGTSQGLMSKTPSNDGFNRPDSMPAAASGQAPAFGRFMDLVLRPVEPTQDDGMQAAGIDVLRTRHKVQYTGTGQALVEAGIVKPHQLPGQVGNGRFTAAYRADGTKVRQGDTQSCEQLGYIRIRKQGSKFIVYLRVPARFEQMGVF